MSPASLRVNGGWRRDLSICVLLLNRLSMRFGLPSRPRKSHSKKIWILRVGLVLGDPSRVQQILWNLLSNAVKFTPKGGHIQVRVTREGANAAISVKDNGKGITEEFLPYVFERFRQADGSLTRKVRRTGTRPGNRTSSY